MDGSASIGLEQALLGHSLGFAPFAAPTQVYVSLCLASQVPSETVRGLEASGGGYARMPATFALIAGPSNVAANTTSIEFPQALSTWGQIGFFELWDAPSGGNRLYWGQLVSTTDFTTPLVLQVSAGDITRFSAGTLGVQASTGAGGTASIGAYLPLAGGQMAGPLLLSQDPLALNEAATKSYVDAHSGTAGGPGFLPLSGGTMLGALTLAGGGGTLSAALSVGTASANYVQISGGAGAPGITTVGATTNVGMNVTGKGTGGVNLRSANGTLAFFLDGGGGSIANAFQFTGTSGTTPATLDVLGGHGFNIRSPWSSARTFTRAGLWTDSIAQLGLTLSHVIGGSPLDTGTMPTSLWTVIDSIKSTGHATALFFNPRYAAGHSGARTGFYAAAGQTGAPATIPSWSPSTAYNVGDLVVNGGRTAFGSIYQATVAGTSAGSGGPTGSGSAILDGTVTWQWGSGWQQSIYQVGGVLASTASYNAGGSAPTSGLCVGNNFGANISGALEPGASNYVGNISCEFDNRIETGSSASVNVGISIAHVPQHTTQGTEQDTCLLIADAAGAGHCVGWRNTITVGSYAADWPVDQSVGYVFQIQNNGRFTPTAAGGFDLNMLQATGNGPEGGGFWWRSPGVKIRNTEVQAGYLSVTADANGAVIDANYSQMTAAAGAITVGTSSADWNTNDTASDRYGNIVQVITSPASLGTVIGVNAVLARGWQATPPANPVTFNSRTRSGQVFGSSLTLNLAWTAHNRLTLQPSGGAIVSPLLTNAANDAAAATAGVAVGQWYRNGSALMQRVA